VTFSRCAICDADLQPWFERLGRGVSRCPACRHIQVPAGVVRLANGLSIYEPEHAEVFEGPGNIDYYLDDGTHAAAVVKDRFVRTYVSSGTLLEIGSSFGHFLAVAGSTFDACGVELNRTAVEWSRSTFQVRNFVGSIYQLPASLPAAFDVIAAWDVIEHLDEPRRALTTCRSRLTPGGWLFLSTPDAGSLVSRMMGRRWVYHDPIQHVNLFSRANLVRMLRDCGFRIEGHTYFGRRYRVKYVLNRLEYLLHDHPSRRLIGVLKRLPQRMQQGSIALKMWDVMGVAARAE
jgi:2-polyprenyl-3-methyl-5-hydroxy-6-metoxy-1,4-benzoquinol methylase